MARQRFIHPSLWDDPDLGKLPSEAMLLYIACFSNADDDGRLVGDAAHLKALAFKYRKVSERRVLEYREMLSERCSGFCVYTVGDTDYIAFLNWGEFQHPKYPKPSALPPPPGGGFPQASPKASGSLPPKIGLGREGLGRDGLEEPSSNHAAVARDAAETAGNPVTRLEAAMKRRAVAQ